MAKVIIFGILDTAELAYYYLSNDSDNEVVAFSVTKDLKVIDNFHGLPVVEFENVEEKYPPTEFSFFVPMTGSKMNKTREKFYNEAKKKGYKLISYISSKATVLTEDIGDNCFILEDNTIQPFTKIGNNVLLWSGNHIGHHGLIEDHVTLTSHVVMSGHCHIKSYCYIGVNATLRDGIVLEEGSFIAMGATIKSNTKSWSVYKGDASKIIPNYSSLDLKF